MSSSVSKSLPSDQAQREAALNPANSILVQAPAGSGKTDLLTRRFLRLLVEVEDPAQIVAITFTKAAAAEMRHRILSKLEAAAALPQPENDDAFSMEALAYRALVHSRKLGWNLLEQPAQLRISTIDSFCREIALLQPLLSGLGDGIGIYEYPEELYHRAARRTLEQIDSADVVLRSALELLLDWRDNNWAELETVLANMLAARDRWIHDFVVEQQQDWDALRQRLERPFANAVHESLCRLCELLDQVPDARGEALALIRFACKNGAESHFLELAELAEFPVVAQAIEEEVIENLGGACRAHSLLACFLLTKEGNFRKKIDISLGFPPDMKAEKGRLIGLIGQLSQIEGLETELAGLRNLPPVRFSDREWEILRACFTLLRNAAGQLHVVFAEAGAVDYIEVAQIAQSVLKGEDGLPSDAAIALAGNIRHILVDEFQDTSRRQHELLRRLIAAWPDRDSRSCFVVGDPMQSIYFFRDADAELFPRVRIAGLEIEGNEPLQFESVQLKDNFRTKASLVERLNVVLGAVFGQDDGSGIEFAAAEPARNDDIRQTTRFKLYLKFLPKVSETAPGKEEGADQTAEIVALIRSHMEAMEDARAKNSPYRIAVLGRIRKVLAPIADALREASIPFRAVELEQLATRPEVLDVLSLTRALLNPFDRIAWLGVLRAPWCGLSLADLHTLTSADDPALLSRPVPELISERLQLLSPEGRVALERVNAVLAEVPALRFGRPSTSTGTWIRSVWQLLGGERCVDLTARGNLELFWQTLDNLPNGEADVLSPAIDIALKKLTAQPDPEAEINCGVQLMTIHKSKGLEFEVVIVPDLQASSLKGSRRMLSWLERGIPPERRSYDSDDVTEFLVAPFQAKGSERGSAKAWVDQVYADRESQEMRRLLYVAATRARDELHLFAQPACKLNDEGEWTLQTPSGTLLATAWPGLEQEIEEQFEMWQATPPLSEKQEAVIETIAAQGNLFEMAPAVKPILLRRLPPAFRVPRAVSLASTPQTIDVSNEKLYERHEGGLLTRALGIAVHSLLEQIARLRITLDWDDVRAALRKQNARVAVTIRAAGVGQQQAAQIAQQALDIALNATRDSAGQWILSPHETAQSEVRLASVVDNEVRNVQVDRLFRAGATPLGGGTDHWWIIDYKSAQSADGSGSDRSLVLERLRPLFAPQIAAYAEVLRKLHGPTAKINAGLYYPRMSLLDWWEI